jgi:CyaY protein
MTDLEFMNEAEQLLCTVERLCDQWNDCTDVDVDVQRTGAVLTLVFPNRTQIVVNLQKPLHEVWLATRAGGFHYRWMQGQWCDTRQGANFWSQLQHCANAQAGMVLPMREC